MNIIKFHWVTLIAIYFVVIAGSVVRMTGSGMGCPDWPKCFDQYVPPTSIQSLPDNYQNYYSSVRLKKIKKFSNFLSSIGLKEKSNQLLEDKSLLYEQPFNVWNTWFEYINRLIGALAGVFIFIGFLLALFTKKDKGKKSLLAFGLIVLTGFQAWWGSMVVATNIVPWVLTVHMVIAAIMIGWQIFIIAYWSDKKVLIPKTLKVIAGLGILFFLFQIILGTQVRQIVDHWLKSNSRSDLEFINFSLFLSHRTVALFLIAYGFLVGTYCYFKKLKLKEVYLFIGLILFEGLIGKLLADFSLPIALQPIHLLVAMISFGCLVRLLFQFKTR
jgi:cytochrome c oxidase assembly protein subunit 15